MNDDPSQPIAEEMLDKRRRPPPSLLKRDKLADYKDRVDDADFVPEPPTY